MRNDLRSTMRELGWRVEAALHAENGDIRCLRTSEIAARAASADVSR